MMRTETSHNSLLIEQLFFGLPASVDMFLGDRRLQKLRPATLKFYQTELGAFLKWAQAGGVENLTDITPQVLRFYFTHLGTTRKTANSLHCAYRAIKTWLKWSWQEYELDTRCPIDRVKVEPPDNSPKAGIPLGDVEKLLDSAAKSQNPKRDTALLLFFLDTGICRSELVRLNVEDLRRDGTVLLSSTTTKNRTARKVFLVPHTRRALAAYLARRGELNPQEPLFVTDANERFTPEGLYQVLRRRIKDAGINPVGFHAFRRTFALETRRGGAGEIETSRLLGHGKNRGDLNQTRQYLDFGDDDLRAAHDANSPVKKLKLRRAKSAPSDGEN